MQRESNLFAAVALCPNCMHACVGSCLVSLFVVFPFPFIPLPLPLQHQTIVDDLPPPLSHSKLEKKGGKRAGGQEQRRGRRRRRRTTTRTTTTRKKKKLHSCRSFSFNGCHKQEKKQKQRRGRGCASMQIAHNNRVLCEKKGKSNKRKQPAKQRKQN